MTALFALAGALLGAAHLHPLAWPCGWVGAGLLAKAFDDERARPFAWRSVLRVALGSLLAVAVQEVVAEHWLLWTCTEWLRATPAHAARLAAETWAALALAAWLPVVGTWLVAARRFRAVVWLPVAWVMGEACRTELEGLAFNRWIVAQWQCPGAMAIVSWVGASLTTLAAFALASSVAAWRTSWLHRVALAVLLGAMLALGVVPRKAAANTDAGGIATLQLPTVFDVPRSLPTGVRFVVWPESSLGTHPTVREGAVHGERLDLPLRAPGVWHLVGLVTYTPHGEAQNSACLVDPEGWITWCRAKRVLVAVGERPVLGVQAGDGFAPGRITPRVNIAGRWVVPLICAEGADEALAREGATGGGDIIVVLASDAPLARSRVAARQALAASVVTAAARGVPVVRASLAGRSVIVMPDGRFKESATNRGEVLTW